MSDILWDELSSKKLRALIPLGPVVIVPIGSTEQHGPHLPVGVDSLLAFEVAKAAARESRGRAAHPVLVMPPLWMGLAEHHMAHAGTLTHSLDGFRTAIAELCSSLDRQGIKRILLLNGHGGNVAAVRVAAEALALASSATIVETTYFRLAAADFAKILEHPTHVQHACEAETSMLLALRPDLVDMEALGDAPAFVEDLALGDVYRWRPIEHFTGNGTIGVPKAANAEKGRLLLRAAASAVAGLIGQEELWSAAADRRSKQGVAQL
jgi:creatinine amidohydrolase